MCSCSVQLLPACAPSPEHTRTTGSGSRPLGQTPTHAGVPAMCLLRKCLFPLGAKAGPSQAACLPPLSWGWGNQRWLGIFGGGVELPSAGSGVGAEQ